MMTEGHSFCWNVVVVVVVVVLPLFVGCDETGTLRHDVTNTIL